MSFNIVELHCPICGNQFMERKPNGKIKFLPNHWQYQVEFENGQRANFGVCKKHIGKLKKKDHEDLLEAHKNFWDNEIEKNPKTPKDPTIKEKIKSHYRNLKFKKAKI